MHDYQPRSVAARAHTEHRVDSAGPTRAPLHENSASQQRSHAPLLQLRAALEVSPQVQSQLALQRALNSRAGASKDRVPGASAPVLQAKWITRDGQLIEVKDDHKTGDDEKDVAPDKLEAARKRQQAHD